MKKVLQLSELINFIHSVYEIECESCKTKDVINNCDEFDALDYFYEQGWRVKDNKCLCKKCQKL